MGSSHSHSHSSPSSSQSQAQKDYSRDKERIKSLDNELNIEKKKIEGITQDLSLEREANRQLRSKLDQLSSICLVSKNNSNLEKADLERAGKKIYGLLSNQYRENIQILETQQRLIDRQNKLAGLKDVTISKQRNKLRDLNRKIQRNDRKLMYNNEDYGVQNKTINILKVSSILCISVLIIYMAIIGFLKIKGKR